MNTRNRTTRIITTFSLFCLVLLGVFVFLYPVLKPVPTGVDSSSYIYGSQWIINHQKIPNPGQLTYQGLRAYTAPLSDVNITILHQLTGFDVIFPLFSYYQLSLIVLLILSAYLVGRLYGHYMSLLYPLALLGSFSIIRLFIGSTVANLLAFSYVNLIYYISVVYLRRRAMGLLIFGLLLLSALFLTHNYLSAPVALVVLLLYGTLLFISQRELRIRALNYFHQSSVTRNIVIFLLLGVIAVYGLYESLPLLEEARNAFWQTSPGGRFMNVVTVLQYPQYLGVTVFTLGVIGVILFIFRRPRDLFGSKSFPILWMAVLLLLLQSYRLGVNFFFERIVFLAGTFIALFAAFAVSQILRNHRLTPFFTTLVIAFVVFLFVGDGVTQVKALYDKSNFITPSQLEVLSIIKQTTTPDEVVYSNNNAVSQTAHDVLMSDRRIIHYPSILTKCDNTDAACIAYTSPNKAESLGYFYQHRMRFFLFMKPSVDGNVTLDRLKQAYLVTGEFETLFQAPDALLVRLR